jgi:hypothetical protein
MNKLEATKLVTRFVVGSSVATCVGSIVKNQFAPRNTKETFQVYVGAFVVGQMVSEQARVWTDRQIDSIATVFKKEDEAPKP